MRAPRVLTVLLVAVASSGCHSGMAEDDTYAARYARSVCAVLGPCCVANGLSFDRDACLRGGAGYVSSGVERAVAAGAVLDAEAADACITGAARLTKSCRPISSDPAVAAACGRAYVGRKQPGAACGADSECADRAPGHGSCQMGASGDGGPAGFCVVRSGPAAAGDGCLAPAEGPFGVADCDATPGLYCNVLSGKCATKQAVGDACGLLLPCAEGAFCDDAGHCAPTLAAGSACATSAACASGLCLRGRCAQNAPGSLAPCTGQAE